MARKSQTSGKAEKEKPRKLCTIFGSDAEHAQLKAAAKSAGMPVRSYARKRVLGGRLINRSDWQRCVQQQAALMDQLERIAQAAEDRASVLDAGRILLALRAIEQQADALMPGAPEAEGGEDDTGEDALLSETEAGPPC